MLKDCQDAKSAAVVDSIYLLNKLDGEATNSFYDQFIKFRSVVIQAISIAWNDPEFKKKLLENPQKALMDKLGYDFPLKGKIDLKAFADNAKWETDTVFDWVVSKQEELTMFIPPKPDKEEEAAEALGTFIREHNFPL